MSLSVLVLVLLFITDSRGMGGITAWEAQPLRRNIGDTGRLPVYADIFGTIPIASAAL